MRMLFRRCPSCGRRFEVKLAAINEVERETESDQTNKPTGGSPKWAVGSQIRGRQGATGGPTPVGTEYIESSKKVAYTYRCEHCGHEWSDEKVESTESRSPAGYMGD